MQASKKIQVSIEATKHPIVHQATECRSKRAYEEAAAKRGLKESEQFDERYA
jgi:hypothetical protein